MSDRNVQMSGRGFKSLDQSIDLDGTTFWAQESSLATQPAVRVYCGGSCLHLSVEQARTLAGDLVFLCDNHYQGGSP